MRHIESSIFSFLLLLGSICCSERSGEATSLSSTGQASAELADSSASTSSPRTPVQTTGGSPVVPAGDGINQTGLPAVRLEDLPLEPNAIADQQPSAGRADQNNTFSYAPPRKGETLYGASQRPEAADVIQRLGDGPLMGALGSLAARQPESIRNAIRFVSIDKAGVRLYAIRLYLAYPAKMPGNFSEILTFREVYIPTDDTFLYSADGSRLGAQGDVFWPALIEKAFAKLAMAIPEKNLLHLQDSNIPLEGYDFVSDAIGIVGTLSTLTGEATNSQPALLFDANNAQVLDANHSPRFKDFDWPLVRTGLNDSNFIGTATALRGPFDVSRPASSQPSPVLPSGNFLTYSSERSARLYHYQDGSTLELTPYTAFSFLQVSGANIAMRSPYGHNQGYSADAAGVFLFPLVDLSEVWGFCESVEMSGR